MGYVSRVRVKDGCRTLWCSECRKAAKVNTGSYCRKAAGGCGVVKLQDGCKSYAAMRLQETCRSM
jgi:hypothetical protein